jgi:hypothetical protein
VALGGGELGLGTRRAHSPQGAEDRGFQSQGTGEGFGLVEAAGSLAGGVQGHGDDGVDTVEQRGDLGLGTQQAGEGAGQGGAGAVFEGVDDVAQGALVEAGGSGAV